MPGELLPHDNNRAEDITDYFDSLGWLNDPTQRRDYLEALDENEFIDLVQQTAGLIRTGQLVNQSFDGKNVVVGIHHVPDHREKEQLLRDTWTTAKEFLGDTNLPDDDALEYAALTVAGGLLYAHPFRDGNGRTSRTLSYMIARGSGNTQELHDILAEHNGGGNWHIEPMPLVADPQLVFTGNQPSQIEWGDMPVILAEDALGNTIASNRQRDTIIRIFIEQHGGQIERQLEESSSLDANGSSNLDGQMLITKLVNDPEAGMTNASELLKMRREIDADYVQRFLEAIRSNEKAQPHEIKPKGIVLSDLEDEFIKGRDRAISIELGRRSVGGEVTPIDQQVIQHRAHSRLHHHRYESLGEKEAA